MVPAASTTSSPPKETYESLLAKKRLQEVNSLSSTADYFLSELEEAISTGNVQKLHEAYIQWLSVQKPDPSTGQVQSGAPETAALHAAGQGQAFCLTYLLERGTGFNTGLVRGACHAKSMPSLEVLLRHGWDINEPEGDCEPPFLA